jgi:Bacterial Ig domain
MGSLIRRTAVVAGVALALAGPAAGARAWAAVAARTPALPVLSWSPATSAGTFDYGRVRPRSVVYHQFTLANSGSRTVSAVAVALTGSVAFTVTKDSCAGANLRPGSSCRVTIRYAPATPGQAATAVLTATSSTAAGHARLKLRGKEARAGVGLTTSPSGGGVVGSAAVTDTAIVTGGDDPTGTITFSLYGPGDTASCTGTPADIQSQTVSGDGSYPTPSGFIPAMAGTYYWVASYGGDSQNYPVTTGCGGESVVITQASPTLSTTPSGSTVGRPVTDSATLSGGDDPTGTITFEAYGPSPTPDCTGIPLDDETVDVSGAGSYTTTNGFTPSQAGTYYWVTTYSGDTDNAGITSGCDQESVTVTSPPPPTAQNQSYNAVGNTPLAVGTSPAGPAATVSGNQGLLDGDSGDPSTCGTLSVTGNTTPAHGTVMVNPDGTFTYDPNAGYTGTDSFQYTITCGESGTTASATVTITVGTLVWYVDNTAASGNGEADSPFATLAAANSAAGADSIIFLYQGSGDYTGGVSMNSGEDLWGQPYGLTADGYTLVAAGGSAPVITNSGGDGIDLAEKADVEGVDVSSPSGHGIAAAGIGDATVGTSNPVAISGAGGDGIHVSGGSGNLDFGGASVTGSSGHSVYVSGRTGGTVTIGGNITDHGAGIDLTGNSGAAISFGGTLTLGTGSNTAFLATGGGMVTAAGTASTITTSTGAAVDVANTTIGGDGLTFQSVSSNGASPGINLSSTGSSGSLTVTGTGSSGSGGTIQKSGGEGIQLSSTDSPSFTDMVIENNAADGINGSQVNGLTLASSTVSGNGTQASVSGENNDGLDFSPNGDGSPDGLTGTVTLSDAMITGSADNNAIISDTSGTLDLTATGSTFSSDNSTTGNDGLHIDADGSTDATVSVTGSTFLNNFGDHFQFSTDESSTGTDSVTFSGNSLNTTASGVEGGGVVISPFGNSHTTLTADDNNIQNSVFTGIAIDENGSTGTLSGTVNGNTIGTASSANSGSQGNDIGVFAEGSVTETLAVTDNYLYQYANEAGISFLDREGNPAMNLTITGNTIADPGSFGSWGLLGQAGAETGDSGTVCAGIAGNSMTGSAQPGQGGADFEIDQQFNTTVQIPGYTGGTENTNAVVSYIQGNNISGGTPSGIATVSGSGSGFTGGPSCPAPS